MASTASKKQMPSKKFTDSTLHSTKLVHRISVNMFQAAIFCCIFRMGSHGYQESHVVVILMQCRICAGIQREHSLFQQVQTRQPDYMLTGNQRMKKRYAYVKLQMHLPVTVSCHVSHWLHKDLKFHDSF